MKKEEEELVSTAFSNTRSMITFIIAVFVLLGLFLLMKSYSSLVEERTIEVKSTSDLSFAKQQLQEQTQKVQQEIGDLRALIT